jgi:tetratricopeptide (TPR) repeat protein
LRELKPKLLTYDYFWILLSSVFKKLDRYDQAEASLSEGLKYLPKNGALYLERSILRKMDDRPREAMEDLNRAIELAPDNPGCYEERISVERRNPEPLHQIHDFDKLIALSVPPEKVKYMVRKAEYLSWMGEVRKAVQVLNQSLYYAPGDQEILNLKKRYCHELERNKIECKECDDQDALKGAGNLPTETSTH